MEEPYLHKLFVDEKDSMKKEKEGRVWLSIQGLTANNPDTNASPDEAVFAYPIKHYTFWRDELNDDSIDLGAMGEDFSILEMDEFTVCVGDLYQIGEAIIEVSQPFWKRPMLDLVEDRDLQSSGRTGWYFRVRKEGYIKAKSDLELIERPYPEWSIAACNEIMHLPKEDLRMTYDLLSCDKLAVRWKQKLRNRLMA